MFGRKDTILTIRGLDMLSKAIQILFIYPRKVRKHLSSNGCMFFCHIITFPGLNWYTKLVIFA